MSIRLSAIAAFALLAVVSGLSLQGCDEGKVVVTGPGECLGYDDPVSGECVPKCDAAKCLAQNTCITNTCQLICGAHTDCGSNQECLPAVEDDTGRALRTCQPRRHFATTVSYGDQCPVGTECDTALTCPNGLPCDPNAPADCVQDTDACGDRTDCSIGKTTDGTACTFNSCGVAECSAMTCRSAGEGDTDSYCTQFDCSEDSECPGGFFCGFTDDPHEICGSSPPKGNNGQCGTTAEPCIDPANFGSQYVEGPTCLMRRLCLKSNRCTPCETSLDCVAGDTEACAPLATGEKICANRCNGDLDCTTDSVCTPNGKACGFNPSIACTTVADCPFGNDTCVDQSVCVPRVGSCAGKAAMAGDVFCHPCLTDLDCGGTAVCAGTSTGLNACIDLGAVTCNNNSECPMSPGGLNGYCLDQQVGVDPQSSLFHTCYIPFDPNLGFTCF